MLLPHPAEKIDVLASTPVTVSHRRLALTAIIAGSVLVRVLYFLQLSSGPCVWQHLWPESDMYFFDRWARTIAAGDWLTDRALHPHVGWHREIADTYFAEHPDAAEAIAREQPAKQPWEALWDHWYADKCFHQEPLYPYLLAVTYGAFGPDVRWVFGWQLAIGVLTNVLVYLVARRHFGDAVAGLAGAAAVLCGPMLLYEMVLTRESLLAFAGMALVFLIERAMVRPAWRSWLAVGAAFGLAVLLKTTFLLFFLGVLAWMAWAAWRTGGRPAGRALARNATALVLGAVLLVSPAIARNVAVGAPATCLSSVGPITFLHANSEDYPPDEGFFISEHAAAILGRTDGRGLPVVIETLRTHPGPGSYLRQLWGKFASLWHWYEKPNNKNFYYYRLHAPVLARLPVTFLIVAPLAMVGLVLAAPRFRRHVSLYLLVATTIAQLLAFYVLSRLRIPLVPALLPFAAFTLTWIGARLREGRWVRAGAAAAAVVALSCWTMRPLPRGRSLIRPTDYKVPYLTYYFPIEAAARVSGDWREAAEVLAESLRYEPEALESVEVYHASERAELAAAFAEVHRRWAEDLVRAGDVAAAAVENRRADELLAAAGSP